jgi:hypothetical protein
MTQAVRIPAKQVGHTKFKPQCHKKIKNSRRRRPEGDAKSLTWENGMNLLLLPEMDTGRDKESRKN